MMEAHSDYRKGRHDEALIKYMLVNIQSSFFVKLSFQVVPSLQLSEIGYEVAQSNAAFMLDRKETTLYEPDELWKRALVYW